jgi:hypothetical protein
LFELLCYFIFKWFHIHCLLFWKFFLLYWSFFFNYLILFFLYILLIFKFENLRNNLFHLTKTCISKILKRVGINLSKNMCHKTIYLAVCLHSLLFKVRILCYYIYHTQNRKYYIFLFFHLNFSQSNEFMSILNMTSEPFYFLLSNIYLGQPI